MGLDTRQYRWWAEVTQEWLAVRVGASRCQVAQRGEEVGAGAGKCTSPHHRIVKGSPSKDLGKESPHPGTELWGFGLHPCDLTSWVNL